MNQYWKIYQVYYILYYYIVTGYDFGTTNVDETVSLTFQITNPNNFPLPYNIDLSNITYFTCTPSQGFIYPNSSLDFLLSYCAFQPFNSSTSNTPTTISIQSYKQLYINILLLLYRFQTKVIPLHAISKQTTLFVKREHQTLHFGTILLGEKRQMKFDMENKSDRVLSCKSVIKGGDFSISDSKHFLISPHTHYGITVIFNPKYEQMCKGMMIIEVEDDNNDPMKIYHFL